MVKKGQKIRARHIDIATFEGTDDCVVVEGIFKDDRFFDMYLHTGKISPPGTIHHMVIRMEVSIPQLIIRDIEVELPSVPHKICRELQQSLDPVRGLPIASGFTRKAKDLVGGTKGCYHLLSLLTAMAPAVTQGAWSQMAREPLPPENHGPKALKRLKNTCWVWREDGPLIKEILGNEDVEPEA